MQFVGGGSQLQPRQLGVLWERCKLPTGSAAEPRRCKNVGKKFVNVLRSSNLKQQRHGTCDWWKHEV